jgi:hypothetical protein
MNNSVADAPTDLSHGIDMYGGGYGFSITGGTLNVVAGGQVSFYPNGATWVASFHGAGLNFATNTTATLGRDPSAAMDAATKQYVDAQISTHLGGSIWDVGLASERADAPDALDEMRATIAQLTARVAALEQREAR